LEVVLPDEAEMTARAAIQEVVLAQLPHF
jgi:hypothetical protein